MTSQIFPSDVLSLRFDVGELGTKNKFQLNRERRCNFGLILITTSERERPINLFCNSLARIGLNLLDTLRYRLLELVESGKENATMLPPATSPQIGQLNISPKPSPQHRQKSVGVFTDTNIVAWKEILQPGHSYCLRFSKNNGKTLACYTDGFDGGPENLPQAQKLTIGREGSTYCFTVHDDPAPPRVFARLEMPHQAHLTGPIPLTLVIGYTTDSLEPLVIDKSRSPSRSSWTIWTLMTH